MAKIVLGLGTSHSPQLSLPAARWARRGSSDRADAFPLWYRGEPHTYAELLERRRGEGLAREITPEQWDARHAACQQGLARLAETLAAAAPDAVVILGDDQNEAFLADETALPTFSVHTGATVDNAPYVDPYRASLGVADANWAYMPPERVTYPGLPALAEHVVRSLVAAGFDPAHSRELPAGRYGTHSVGHAFGFVYRRIMLDRVIPNLPVFINTYYPPNQPTAGRCYALGRALRQAIESWDGDARVAVVGSGGLTHFVIEEELDRQLLDAMQARDHATLMSIPEPRLMSGSSEIKNWIALAGVMADGPLTMELVDYVPCYRTEAGTGVGMAFARWQ